MNATLPREGETATPAQEMIVRYGIDQFEVQANHRKVKVFDDYSEAVAFAQSIIDFDERREAKVERYQGYADNAANRADARFKAADRETAGIPFGQPILVGHHSEKRHRRALDKSWANGRKGVEEFKKSEHWQRRAAAADNDTSIRSDDPLAQVKLKDRIADLERQRDAKKEFNKQRRAGKSLDDIQASTGMRDSQPWELTNLGANIRRLKDRLALIERIDSGDAPKRAYRTITAKFDGDCPDCGEVMEKGTQISKTAPRRWVHATCIS